MSLAAGSRLGPYEIVAPIGAGGMGEVYRARDERLKRDVAVKVLPASYSQDGDRLRRFEQEAQAAGALNHPNITAVYDLGSHDGAPYIVTELLEGETLRARLSGGAIGVRKATDYAVQIAKGLAAAHEKGIIHRDLKPENLFVTNDGRMKILDFGLAKLTQPEGQSGPQTNLPTASGTEPGVVMGTLGYMSPEQVKGKPADQRSDIFAFGAILYEMLSGSRAFHRDSAAETMSAILREDPPDLSATNKSVQPSLERIVRHCLEKNPEERFYSTRDVAFDLEALSGLSAPQVPAAGVAARRTGIAAPVLVALAIAAAAAAGYWLHARRGPPLPPSFQQLTFRRGTVWSARFGADEKSVVYSAAWEGLPEAVFIGSSSTPEARPFGLERADVLAVSRTGEIAVCLNAAFTGAFTRKGTLARVSAAGGGAPREILENVEGADWTPDGKDLVVVRNLSGKYRIEFPIGKVLYETAGWLDSVRFSPRGDRVAFLEHPANGDDGGIPSMIDLTGRKTSLTPLYASTRGLAWSPDGSEVWYTAAEVGGNRSLFGVKPSGRPRLLARVTGSLTLADAAADGRVLMMHDTARIGTFAFGPGETRERNLTWFDWSLMADLSDDGRTMLFNEAGEGGGEGYSTFLRQTDGSPALRVGEGSSQSLSPDGKWVLAILHPTTDRQLTLYPTGAGQPRALSFPSLQVLSAVWMTDSRHLLVTAQEGAKARRVYLVDSERGDPKPVTPEGFGATSHPLDATHFLGRNQARELFILSTEGGEPVPVPGVAAVDTVVGIGAKPGTLYVRRGQAVPARVVLLEFASGREEKWKDIAPADPTGFVAFYGLRVTPDGRSYAYSAATILSDLYLVRGVK
ncbi:MAG TPA: protein kinase [Thermoanaerobaculia bacterium]|jgi:Tol biopolymer transport system component|nr:protein kinase [Thermoanaerobaculia bacterium]